MSLLDYFIATKFLKFLKATKWSEAKLERDRSEEFTTDSKYDTKEAFLWHKDDYGEGENYSYEDSVTSEEKYSSRDDTFADEENRYDDEISNYDESDSVTDEDWTTDENESYVDYSSSEDAIYSDYEKNNNVSVKDFIKDGELYLDEDEKNDIYDAWEIEIYGAFYASEHELVEENKIEEYRMREYEEYENNEEFRDEIDNEYGEDEKNKHDEDSVLREEIDLGRDETCADDSLYDDEIHNYDKSDNVTEEHCSRNENETNGDYEEYESEIHNYQESSNVTDEDCTTDENESYVDYSSSEDEIYSDYDKNNNVSVKDFIKDGELYLDEDEKNDIYEAWEIEIYGAFYSNEHELVEENKIEEYYRMREYEECRDVIDDEYGENINYSDEDRIKGEEIHPYKDKSNAKYEVDDNDDEIPVEVHHRSKRCIQKMTTHDPCQEEGEECVNSATGDDKCYSDWDSGKKVIKDDLEEYSMKEEEVYIEQDRSKNETYSDCRNSVEEYWLEEREKSKNDAYIVCDSEENFIESGRASDEDHNTKEQEKYSEKNGGKSKVFIDCDSIEKETLKTNILKLDLFIIFRILLHKLVLDFNLKDKVIKGAILNLNNNFRNVINGRIPTELDFNDMNNCVGYLHRFAICHASMVLTLTLELLKSPVEMSGIFTSNDQLNVVSFGSGPGNDLVGFFAAFHDQHLKWSHLDITIVDKMSGWHHVFKQTIHILKEEDCNVGRVFREVPDITTSFFQADMEQSTLWCNGMIAKLEKADIVFLVKVLSNIPDENKLRTLEDIVARMKPGAVVFFIDCPIPFEEFSALSSLKTIYKTKIQLFRLDFRLKCFGHYNIKACKAGAHIFVKRN